MASWRREMGTPGNWRACVAYVDRVDRGRFSSSPGSDPSAPAGSEDERLDLSVLSEEQLRYLENLYADPDESQDGE